MAPETKLDRAIARAEALLPGKPAPEGRRDPRWQAIIRVGDFIEAFPLRVWAFALRWGKHAQEDLRTAVATCLLEHLLEYHFDLLWPKVRAASRVSPRFRSTLNLIAFFGQAAKPANRAAIERAQAYRPRRRSRGSI